MLRRLLIIALAAAGVGFGWPWLSDLGLGRLPGDMTLQIGEARVYAPLTTSIGLAIALGFLVRIVGR